MDTCRGFISLVLVAWHANTEFRSWRPTDGQCSRFSITAPPTCSHSSSMTLSFLSHTTDGCGFPANQKRKPPVYSTDSNRLNYTALKKIIILFLKSFYNNKTIHSSIFLGSLLWKKKKTYLFKCFRKCLSLCLF